MKIVGNTVIHSTGVGKIVNRKRSFGDGLMQLCKFNTRSLLLLLVLAGCGPMGKLAALSEAELRREVSECKSIASKSNSKAIACQNFTHECEKRVKADGNYRSC
jgi:hypothetical protein